MSLHQEIASGSPRAALLRARRVPLPVLPAGSAGVPSRASVAGVVDSVRVCPECRGEYALEVLFCPRDGTPLTGRSPPEASERDPYLGREIAGQFRIERLLGVGAMGRVYRAHQRDVERPVAIKILRRDLMSDAALSERFRREARVVSRLSHPNVVGVFMSGELPATGEGAGGEAYLVMEFLDGPSLRSALAAAGGALPLPRALHVMLQVCDAVGEAHAHQIVHRDLKPENVMLVRRGDDRDFAKVLDFGVARVEHTDATVATQEGVIFGTARYVSPEGARGEVVTAASDVYSLAVMLFECLAGRAPFEGPSPLSILVQHTAAPAPELRDIERASYVPDPIARVVALGLAKDPTARPPNARELGRALVEAARASGLRPDDLVTRSPLLGDGTSVTQLASLERTRALELQPSLAARLGVATSAPESPPAAEPRPPPDGESPRSRRALVAALCVATGTLLGALVATRLGACAPREGGR